MTHGIAMLHEGWPVFGNLCTVNDFAERGAALMQEDNLVLTTDGDHRHCSSCESLKLTTNDDTLVPACLPCTQKSC